jgi:hypothetical protein
MVFPPHLSYLILRDEPVSHGRASSRRSQDYRSSPGRALARTVIYLTEPEPEGKVRLAPVRRNFFDERRRA